MALTNPEKSLTGTVPSSRYDEPGRTFRYAPLSSGLDIVRKVLGEQGIATLQTTTIDQDIQSVSLTTMLAHASGEWIASDRPVCTLSDLGAPRRMGAALTYARRYALFTLVGIAGEDDLDAPDLGGQPAEGTGETGNDLDTKRQNGDGADQPLGTFARNRNPWSPPNQALAPEESAALCDRMVSEISALASEEQATAWAHKAIMPRMPSPQATVGLWRLRSPRGWPSSPTKRIALIRRRTPTIMVFLTQMRSGRRSTWRRDYLYPRPPTGKTWRRSSGRRGGATMRWLGMSTKAPSNSANRAATAIVRTSSSCRPNRA
jgi:hypothetical protein